MEPRGCSASATASSIAPARICTSPAPPRKSASLPPYDPRVRMKAHTFPPPHRVPLADAPRRGCREAAAATGRSLYFQGGCPCPAGYRECDEPRQRVSFFNLERAFGKCDEYTVAQ